MFSIIVGYKSLIIIIASITNTFFRGRILIHKTVRNEHGKIGEEKNVRHHFLVLHIAIGHLILLPYSSMKFPESVFLVSGIYY